MAFVPKEWKDRLVEFAGRRKLTNVATGEEIIVDVARNEGAVSQEGDAFSAENMNELEQRVSEEFTKINTNLTNENGEQFRYGYQDGKRGMWVKEADTDVFVPFNKTFTYTGNAMCKCGHSSSWNITLPLEHDTDYVIAFCSIWHFNYHPVINETWFPECTAELIYRNDTYFDSTRGIAFSIWKLTNVADSVKIYKADTTENIGGLTMGIAYQ